MDHIHRHVMERAGIGQVVVECDLQRPAPDATADEKNRPVGAGVSVAAAQLPADGTLDLLHPAAVLGRLFEVPVIPPEAGHPE